MGRGGGGHLRPTTSRLLTLLLLLPLASMASFFVSDGSLKRRCQECNQPDDCQTGHCVGDLCVKTVADSGGERYVSKGCDNYTAGSHHWLRERRRGDYSTCVTERILGVDQVICYCNDADYCNSSHRAALLLPILSSLIFLLVYHDGVVFP